MRGGEGITVEISYRLYMYLDPDVAGVQKLVPAAEPGKTLLW